MTDIRVVAIPMLPAIVGSKRTVIRGVQDVLPPLNFLTVHYLYFILMGFIWSVILWGCSQPPRSVSYTDSLFLAVSAMTGAGLNTVNLSTLTTFQQVVLYGLILLGHPILISSTVLFVRKRAFETKFQGIAQQHTQRHLSLENGQHIPLTKFNRKTPEVNGNAPRPDELAASSLQSVEFQTGLSNIDGAAVVTQPEAANPSGDSDAIRWVDDDQITVSYSVRERARHRVFRMEGVGTHPDIHHPRDAAHVIVSQNSHPSAMTNAVKDARDYSWSKGSTSRNSQFYGLTATEREKLGGVEYKAVSFLSIIVPLYYVLFNLLGIIGLGSWLTMNRPAVAQANGLNPFWTGTFFAASAFANSGMSLLDLNMTVLQTSTYMLLTMGFLILAGNTLFPCFLRFIIWTIRYALPKTKWCQEWKPVLDFILDHPRRVYTHLFPKRHTWYLLATVIILNGIDWAGFELLSIGNEDIERLGAYRVLDGLFQAFAVRSGGFYVVNIANLHQGLLVLYVLMMYVSAFPVLLTLRNTNVYEERSLGIYANDNLTEDQRRHASLASLLDHVRVLFSWDSSRRNPTDVSQAMTLTHENTSRSYFLRQQLRSQLSHDIWWICLAVLFITIAEGPHYAEDPVAYSTFNIIFEVVSAYGCVGISVGVPNQNYSFCGGWFTISKLILVAVMLRGRHRSLPVAIDKAVMLPDGSLAWAEEEDAAVRLERSKTWTA